MKQDPNFLHLAADLQLPSDAVTQTFGFIARKGGGKTYASQKLAEEMITAGAQVVCMDPVGNWYALRLSSDGVKPGLPIYVFGGERGDIPLHPDSGGKIARLLVEKRISAVLDVSAFRKGDRRRFATDFAEEFFHAKKSQRSPVHLFLEEAQKLVPQVPEQDERRMLGAFEDIVRLGRNYGIGATMISQRPQSINKEVLSQVECLAVGQTNGVHERKAIDAWVSEHGLDRGLLGELPSLKVGQMFVWSPQWLKVFKKVSIAAKRTFDASATPRLGQSIAKVGELSPLDIRSLEQEFSETIERAKADDPRELRQRIAELEKASKQAPAADPKAINHARREAARAVHEQYSFVISEVSVALRAAGEKLALVASLLSSVDGFMDAITESGPREAQAAVSPVRPSGPVKPDHRPSSPPANGKGHVSGGLRRMMIALAQRPQGLSARQLGVRAGLSSSSGTFGTYLAKGRTEGVLEGSRDRIRITEAGLAQLGSYQPLPTGRDLLAYWTGELGGGAARMLEALADAYPRALTKSELGRASGLAAGSGTFGTYLSKLRTLELIEGSSEIRMSEELA